MKLLIFLMILLPLVVFLINIFISRFIQCLEQKYEKRDIKKKLRERRWETDMELLNLEVQKGLLKEEIELREQSIGKYAEVRELELELKEVNKLINSIKKEDNI
ncbi:hypothetical protein [Staphylococcus chromogenes]|uniref:hypothetical protein n=1 Tax=Staphylococcus chromogenes TaxID=46126 RepID=UPI002887CEF1|nr:hypothetical protein [Staphylococcus chromogenes]MDT0700332.1 hypothetical protein [Staphylococcus chromogenes]